MSTENTAITKSHQIQKYHPTTLVIGGLIGAAAGVACAYLLTRKFAEDESVRISASEGVKVGALLFGFLRSVAAL